MGEDSKASTYSLEDDIQDKKDTEEYFYSWEDKATPLFELSSISITCGFFRKFSSGDFFFRLKLIDDNAREFTLLEDRVKNILDHIMDIFDSSDLLALILAKSELNHPRLLPKHLFLQLSIEDRSQGNLIMHDRFCLDFSSKVVFDKEQYSTFVHEVYGNVKVCYTIFRYAVFASVECKVVKNEKADDLYDVVSGTITATSKLWNGQSIEHDLLNNLHPDETMLCSTSCFPVPVYSPLKIHAKLEIDNEIIESDENGLEFEASEHTQYKKEIRGKKWRILVAVSMNHVNHVVPENVMRDYDFKHDAQGDSKLSAENEGISDIENSSMSGEERNEFLEMNKTSIAECGKVSAESENISKSEDIPENEEIQHGREEKRLRTHCVEHPVSDMSIERIDPLRLPRHRFLPLVELFSISACPYVDNTDKLHRPLRLYGTIRSFDVKGNYDIFNGVEENSTLLHPHETIPFVDTPRCYLGFIFGVQLDLKDDQGRVISKGHMQSCLATITYWKDRRICSVVQGKDGFAAVHHIMFSDAVQAKVKVSVRSKDGRACQVRGKIWAKYNGHKYPTVYEKKYYQSVLFKEEKTKLVELRDGVDLPLLKSVVAVPFHDVLVVKLNLYIVIAGKEELLKGKALFKPEESEDPKILSAPQIIEGPSCDVTVVVEWG